MKPNRTTAYWPPVAALSWLAAMAWVWSEIGAAGLAWGLPLSIAITLPMVATFLWLHRWAQGRPGLLLSAFAWGASVAGLCSIWSQEGLQALIDAHAGVEFGTWFRPLVITPVTEELFKGLFLVWMLVYRRSQIRGLLDGIVYGGLIGAGFAFSEQTLYFGQAIIKYVASDPANSAAATTLAMSFVLRALMVPFMHSFFVAFIGMGVAASVDARSRVTQGFGVVLGFLFPIVLHGVWDWSALAGDDPFMIFKIYAVLMLPLFVALAILAIILRRHEGKDIAAALPGLAWEGHIAEHEIALLGSMKERRRWQREARRRAGWAAARSVGRYQAEASALAILTVRTFATGRHDIVREQALAVSSARRAMAFALNALASEPVQKPA